MLRGIVINFRLLDQCYSVLYRLTTLQLISSHKGLITQCLQSNMIHMLGVWWWRLCECVSQFWMFSCPYFGCFPLFFPFLLLHKQVRVNCFFFLVGWWLSCCSLLVVERSNGIQKDTTSINRSWELDSPAGAERDGGRSFAGCRRKIGHDKLLFVSRIN